MSSSVAFRRGFLATLAATALFFVAFHQDSADASTVTKGAAVITVPSGKAGLVTAIRPAKVTKRFGRRGARVTGAVRNAHFGKRVGARVLGGIRFSRGKRRVPVTGLRVRVFARQTLIRGRIRGRYMNVFRAVGRTKLNRAGGRARLARGRLALTGRAARTIRRALKLRRTPRGAIGRLFVNFSRFTEPVIDPYLAECGLEATSELNGNLTPAGPPPTLSNTVASSPDPITWGFRASFRGYMLGTGGTYAGIDGVTIDSLPFPGPPPLGFTFPAADSAYAPNDSGSGADDQAVINGSGTLVICHKAHGFRIALSEPTIVVDGADSRLIFSVDTNRTGEWTPAQRVVLADLDTASSPAGVSGDTVAWDDVAVSLTAVGSRALRLCEPTEGGPTNCEYEAGAAMDPISFSLSTG